MKFTGKAVILIGVSGSGKSTKARALAEAALSEGLSVEIHSTDNYFIGSDGVYRFDKDQLSYNHGLNLDAFQRSCREGVDLVVCDNTNLLHEHRWRYVMAALSEGYEVELMEVGDLRPETLKVCASRNIHGLDQGMINRQSRMYEKPRRNYYTPKEG